VRTRGAEATALRDQPLRLRLTDTMLWSSICGIWGSGAGSLRRRVREADADDADAADAE
jgi:hypothetical protein